MEIVTVAASPLAIDTTNGHRISKRKIDYDTVAAAPLVASPTLHHPQPPHTGCPHAPSFNGDQWLRTQLHATLRRARQCTDALPELWNATDAPSLLSERVFCLSCAFYGRREDACDEAQCFMTHAMRANHHFALLPRKKQLFCARCVDFVYPHALLVLTQRETPSHHAPHRHHPPHTLVHRPHQHHHRAPSLRRRLLRSSARRGLVNMGNTCFMNAVLQALAHNPLVQHEYFVVRSHNTTICEQRRRHDAQQNAFATDPQAGPVTVDPCMGCEMSSLMQTLFPAPRATLTARHLTSPVVPQAFLETFWASSPSFIGSQQQDAHEFLVALLNGIHTDTCARSASAHSSTGTTDDSTQRAAPPTSPRFSPTGQSLCDCVVHQNFAGVFSSEIACVFCETVSSKYDPFLDITLALEAPTATPRKPRSSRPKDGDATADAPQAARLSLETLLDRFTVEERLKGSNQVYCRRCSRYVDAIKRLVIHKLPNLLVLHLGRFDFAKKRKITDAVTFPLRGLDLREFCSDVDAAPEPVTSSVNPSQSRNRRDAVAAQTSNGKSSPMTPTTPRVRDAMYDLAAVICHHGDMADGGHFTAFVHSAQETVASAPLASTDNSDASAASPWLHFDDVKVERVTPQRVEESQAYMLLYVRRRLFV